ncbi:hypothetical protein BAOM_1239 [Peribacillus asahii]|uniref:Uncharacterized protein n=1 Tax=Peribacillus asahii TaxID=228899 RepID=A0A3Q9RHQ2_9BACI|nr:hypothetical protein [Peribacillus asahii]AZV41849.1 hypothetical protein BAOM_1239 [Peribacillus asahii]
MEYLISSMGAICYYCRNIYVKVHYQCHKLSLVHQGFLDIDLLVGKGEEEEYAESEVTKVLSCPGERIVESPAFFFIQVIKQVKRRWFNPSK